MSSNIYNSWKGKEKSISKTSSPMIGMVYKGSKNKGKGQGREIVGVLMEIHPTQGDAILRDRENFPYCVSYDSLELQINNQ